MKLLKLTILVSVPIVTISLVGLGTDSPRVSERVSAISGAVPAPPAAMLRPLTPMPSKARPELVSARRSRQGFQYTSYAASQPSYPDLLDQNPDSSPSDYLGGVVTHGRSQPGPLSRRSITGTARSQALPEVHRGGFISGARVPRGGGIAARSSLSATLGKNPVQARAAASGAPAVETAAASESGKKPNATPTPKGTPIAKDEVLLRPMANGRIEAIQNGRHVSTIATNTPGSVVYLDGTDAANDWERVMGELFLFTSLPDLAGAYVGEGFQLSDLPTSSLLRAAALQSGDTLAVIGGLPIASVTVDSIPVNVLGSQLAIKVLRSGSELTIVLVRAAPIAPSQKAFVRSLTLVSDRSNG